MKYKLIVTDLDDTLLRDDQTLSQRSVDAVGKALERGIRVTIATGRMFPSALPYARALGLTGPMLCCQGAQIADIETGRSIRETAVPLDLAREALRFAEERGLYAQFYSPEDYYFERECAESAYYARVAGVVGRAMGKKCSEALDFEPIKLLVIADPPLIRKAYAEAAERFGDRLAVAISKSNYLEITHPDANKGAAVAELAGMLGLRPHEVTTCGDALNDLPMLKFAGLGIAVANGDEQVKSQADAVTAANEDDGVALAIEKYALTE